MAFWFALRLKLAERSSKGDAKRDARNFQFLNSLPLLGQVMLPKKNRADTSIVNMVFKDGKFINSPFLTFKYKLNEGSKAIRISFLAPKSIAKLAVKRNLLRRRGHQALKKYITDFPVGIVGVFVYKREIATVTLVENEIKSILNKIH
jgi:ribonuclease P protein component